jgi:hypothetical protein
VSRRPRAARRLCLRRPIIPSARNAGGRRGAQAAKDKKCAHFDSDFRVELFYLPLSGQTGTGPALDRARAAAAAAAPAAANPAAAAPPPAAAAAAAYPLASDRDAHSKAVQALTALGHPAPSFDDWLLGRAAAPGPPPYRPVAARPGSGEAAEGREGGRGGRGGGTEEGVGGRGGERGEIEGAEREGGGGGGGWRERSRERKGRRRGSGEAMLPLTPSSGPAALQFGRGRSPQLP